METLENNILSQNDLDHWVIWMLLDVSFFIVLISYVKKSYGLEFRSK